MFDLAFYGLSLSQPGKKGEEAGKKADEEALQKTAEAFVAAFNKGDAKGIAAFFTADADVVDPDGHRIQGRKAIEETYSKYFVQAKGSKALCSDRIRAHRQAGSGL